mgnify:CR=1 FL=1
MVRGITFISKTEMSNEEFIKIFNDINLDKYKIKTGFQELYNPLSYDSIQDIPDVSWGDFKKFCDNNKFITIFLELFAYKQEINLNVLPNDYEDFLKSEFELAVFIYDSKYLDFYCKRLEVLEKVMKNISTQVECSFLGYITDENDERKKFRVW